MSLEVDFARLNHILIPKTRADRDRLRNSRIGRAMRPLLTLYESSTTEGSLVFTMVVIVGLLGLDIEHSSVYQLWSVLAGLLTAGVLFAPRYKLRSARIEVRAPARATVGEDITFSLVVHNDAAQTLGEVRARGPFLPWDGRWTSPPTSFASVPANQSVRTQLRARFIARGEHHLDPFRAGRVVPLGLALGPNIHSAGCRFVIVPRVANVARVTTVLGRRHQRGGVALASNTGESLDLRGVRPYRAGDPLRDLHAKSWARTGQPMVREYQQEYYTRVGVLLDIDETLSTERRREAAISLAAGVIGRIAQGDSMVDLVVPADAMREASVGRGTGTFEHALDVLGCVESSRGFDVDAVLAHLAARGTELSSVLVIMSGWNASRIALLDRLETLGAGVRVLLVSLRDDEVSPDARVRVVSQSSIERRAELSL